MLHYEHRTTPCVFEPCNLLSPGLDTTVIWKWVWKSCVFVFACMRVSVAARWMQMSAPRFIHLYPGLYRPFDWFFWSRFWPKHPEFWGDQQDPVLCSWYRHRNFNNPNNKIEYITVDWILRQRQTFLSCLISQIFRNQVDGQCCVVDWMTNYKVVDAFSLFWLIYFVSGNQRSERLSNRRWKVGDSTDSPA